MPKSLKLPSKIDKKLNGNRYASDALIEAKEWLDFYNQNLLDILHYVNEIADLKGL